MTFTKTVFEQNIYFFISVAELCVSLKDKCLAMFEQPELFTAVLKVCL